VKRAPLDPGHETDDATAVVDAALPALIGFVARDFVIDDFVFVLLTSLGLVAKESVTVDFVFVLLTSLGLVAKNSVTVDLVLVLVLVLLDADEIVVLLEVLLEDFAAAARTCMPTVPLLGKEAFLVTWRKSA
jgi:hypothetical protein